MRRLCLPSLVALAFTLSLSAADWPRFRGPNGMGVADGTLPVIDAKAALWKVEIPGRGAGSPIVVAGKVFLQSSTTDGSKRILLCLNATEGKALWTKELPGKKVKTHPHNTLASATPAADGERVYCVSWDGDSLTLLAYTLAGKELWSQPLGGFVSQHGPGHSPIVYNGSLYFVANDGTSGAELWTITPGTLAATRVKDLNPGSGSSSPNNLMVSGGWLYFTATTPGGLYRTDGTTVTLVTSNSSFSFPGPSNYAPSGGKVFFVADMKSDPP